MGNVISCLLHRIQLNHNPLRGAFNIIIMTKGKLICVIIYLVVIINTIIYIHLKGSPYKESLGENAWSSFTGLSMGVFGFFTFAVLIAYMIDNWNTPLKK
jgi:hypothetical protein